MIRTLVFISMLFISLNLNAQDSIVINSSSSDFNIRALLNKQIEEIRAKEYTPIVPAEVENKKLNGVFFKVFLGIEVMMIVLISFLIKNYILDKNNEKRLKLKRNIAYLREEKFAPVFNPVNTRKIFFTRIPREGVLKTGKEITEIAKKYSLSKGEVHLYNKLKIMAGNLK